MVKTPLGTLLQHRREELGYSRTRLGEIVGIRPATIESWELGRVAKPPLQDVLVLARFLEIPTEEIARAALGEVEAAPRVRSAGARAAVALLEEAFEFLGWDEGDAAHELSVPRARVRAWRRGEVALTMPEIMAIAAMVGRRAAAVDPTS